MKITWEYSGYCRAAQETAIEFSIDAESNIPFDALDCFAYDLAHDPARKHAIRPMLIGSDGLSKKIAVPFLEPLMAQQRFCVFLKCTLPGCMKAGIAYYTSTLSFGQDKVRRCVVRLIFAGNRPDWVRVYESNRFARATLLKDLQPLIRTGTTTEYEDDAKGVTAESARIYVFRRGVHHERQPSLEHLSKTPAASA